MASELKILKGKVKNLHFENATKDFFNSNLQNKAGVAAIGAAAVGAFAASTVLTSVSGNMRDRVQIFSCTVKGVELSGCFKEITFKEGDKIEFVVEYNPDNSEEAAVHAARDTKKKILSVLPYQDRGEIAYRKGSLKFIAGFCTFCILVMLIVTFLASWKNNFEIVALTQAMIFASFAIGTLTFLIMMIGRKKEIPFAIKATKVFEVLGYKNPAHVDSTGDHLKASRIYYQKYGDKHEALGTWVNYYQDSDLEK